MEEINKPKWIFGQNSSTYWYMCSKCGWGKYDGYDWNQTQREVCPCCKSSMQVKKDSWDQGGW